MKFLVCTSCLILLSLSAFADSNEEDIIHATSQDKLIALSPGAGDYVTVDTADGKFLYIQTAKGGKTVSSYISIANSVCNLNKPFSGGTNIVYCIAK